MHFNFASLLAYMQPVLGLAAVSLAALIHRRLKTPLDHERAAHLSLIAREAAALLVAEKKNANWAVLLEDLIRQITANESAPTSNVDAIRRAAAGALSSLGVKS